MRREFSFRRGALAVASCRNGKALAAFRTKDPNGTWRHRCRIDVAPVLTMWADDSHNNSVKAKFGKN